MATALGTRARGVLTEGRFLDGNDDKPVFPAVDVLPPNEGFGVDNGDPKERVGDESIRDPREGEEGGKVEEEEEEGGRRAGLGDSRFLPVGLSIIRESRELSCCAVIDIYFDALDPAVILSVRETSIPFEVTGLNAFLLRAIAAGVVTEVPRPFVLDGVNLPPAEGVARPFANEADGVLVAEGNEGVTLPDSAGVIRPLEDATDEGL